MRKLSELEVKELYKKHPEIKDEYYLKRVFKKVGEIVDMEMDVGGKKFLVKSNPVVGDKWWEH